MSGLAVFLLAVGLSDICRRLIDRAWPALLAGPLVVVLSTVAAGLWHRGDLPLLAVAALACVAWVRLSERAEQTGTGQGAALTVFGCGVAALFLLSGWASPVGGLVATWLDWAGWTSINPDRALMLVAVVLVQLVSANQLVRLVLGAVGAVRPAGQPQPSDRLKGGRLLGPMERLLIVGLGLGGQLAMASAVVAAKGIIRFPELNAQRRQRRAAPEGAGIDEVTEYFLVGSFASWLVALAGLVLTLPGS